MLPRQVQDEISDLAINLLPPSSSASFDQMAIKRVIKKRKKKKKEMLHLWVSMMYINLLLKTLEDRKEFAPVLRI